MQIDSIIRILPPPSMPNEIPNNGWAVVEDHIGTALPADYKAFIERYGSGRIDGFLWVFNPFSQKKNINLLDQIEVRVGGLKYLLEEFSQPCPYPLFPQPGGLFPFAGTDNGNTIYWITRGNPDEWWVVVNEARGPRFEEFRSNAIAFLHGILTKRSVCDVLPREFPRDVHDFNPIL